jgi:phosphoribosylformylglycinamidine (FGAM) synthase PurS component
LIDIFWKKFKIGGELNFDIKDINVAKYLGITFKKDKYEYYKELKKLVKTI